MGESQLLGGDCETSAPRSKPGVVLYPLRMQTPFDAPTNLLPEEKARADLHQAGFIEARTSGLVRTELNTYPVLLTPQQSSR